MIVPEEQVRRKRRRRRRRRGGGGGGGGGEPERAVEEKGRRAEVPDWQWRTFPVLFAFVLGMLVMAFAFSLPGIGVAFFFIAIGGVAFGLAHILTRQIIARRRGR